MKNYQNLFLYPNQSRPVDRESCRGVASFLEEQGYTLFTCDAACAEGSVTLMPAKTAFAQCDAAIVLGGDGTMLAAARYAKETGIPLLGINFGTLGYMSELELFELELLKGLQEARVEERMLLEATVDCNGQRETMTALNECAICRAKPGTLIRLELFCDGNAVCMYRGDGMILSTPTGSSAYNLSAGGPIIDPKLNAFCVSSLAPHSLSAMRSMVFSPQSVLQVQVEGEASVAADSVLFREQCGKMTVTVRQSDRTVKLLKLKNAGFYEAVREKLT